jgi:D-lactate dehydrogenase
MRVAFFSTKIYARAAFEDMNGEPGHELVYFEPKLDVTTAPLADGFPVVCAFVNDELGGPVLEKLHAGGTRLIALRSAGFNHVDLETAERLGMTVLRVPAYSPYAVAEHTVALMMALNRKTHRAYNRVRDGNFALDGLVGFDVHGRTAGIVGTGKIGAVVAKIMHGFGCHVLAYDLKPNPECEHCIEYVSLPELFSRSDIITLHCPLTPDTHHLIDPAALDRMKDGVMLLNTSRGALIDAPAAINALKSGRIGYLGLDVYEEEADLFFEDLSDKVLQDDVFARLVSFPNVLVTGHQAFLTREALANIAEMTLSNVTAFEAGRDSGNEVRWTR